MEPADATNSTAAWMTIAVMVLHWAGPVMNRVVDAVIARWLAGSPEAAAIYKARQEGK